MPTITADKLAQRLVDLDLVSHQEVQFAIDQLGRHDLTAEQLSQCLMGRNLLTNWQVERLLNDYRVGFFYGRYKVLYLAGAGTFARVYRAVDNQDGRVVAVKVLRTRHLDSKEMIERFLREAKVGLTLKHPNIVEVLDMGSNKDEHYFVMEFVEGNNLREFMRIRKQLEPAEATRIMIDITEGLRFAWQKGYAHRDMKLSNVLLSSKGEAKLVDFGLAAKRGEPIPRTVDYAGLEKATGAPKDDPRSDLFFLGCMFYHMLVGQPALYESKDRAARAARSRFMDFVPARQAASSLPGSLVTVLEHAMELNPTRRYQTPTEMLLELRQAAMKLGDASAAILRNEDSDKPAAATATVMLVESDPDLQQTLREGLKRAGYRVLLTVDPQRALDRVIEQPTVADLVIFSAAAIGGPALAAFNRYASEEPLCRKPGVLILGADQQGWKKRAQTNAHRGLLAMPVTMRALRETVLMALAHELPDENAAPPTDGAAASADTSSGAEPASHGPPQADEA